MTDKRPMKKAPGISNGIFYFLYVWSAAFIGLGGYLMAGNLDLRVNSEKLEGRVIDHEEIVNRDDKGRTHYSYAPIVEFTAATGIKAIKSSRISSSKDGYPQGNQVEFYYLPDKEKILINSVFRVYAFPGIFLAAGLIVFFFNNHLHRRRMFINKLKKEGHKVEAAINEIKPLVTVNKLWQLYKVRCQRQDPWRFRTQNSTGYCYLPLRGGPEPPKTGDTLIVSVGKTRMDLVAIDEAQLSEAAELAFDP